MQVAMYIYFNLMFLLLITADYYQSNCQYREKECDEIASDIDDCISDIVESDQCK